MEFHNNLSRRDVSVNENVGLEVDFDKSKPVTNVVQNECFAFVKTLQLRDATIAVHCCGSCLGKGLLHVW